MEYGAVVVWWVALVGLGAVGLPIAAFVLRTLPDRGAALALPTALVVLFVPVYWLGHVHFGPVTVAAGAVVLAALSIALARRSPPVDLGRFVEWVVVFTLAFLLVVAIRAFDPSIVPPGGEKFLDFGLLRTLLRASKLPPEDMWFADAPVAYYYGGHLLAASLATLTNTAARYAYNLALGGFYATLVGAAYGVAGSMAEARGRSYRWAGALGAFFVGVASNVVPLLQAFLWVLPVGTAKGLAADVASRTALPAKWIVSPATFSYWTASRVIPGTINEFPLFSFLNGDLHAHMSSTPFLLLVVGVCLAYYLTPETAVRRRRLLVFGAVPPVAGLLVVVNTWSLPTAVGVTGLAVLFAETSPRDLLPDGLAHRLPPSDGSLGELVRMGVALVVGVVVALLAVLWALPFVLGPATGASGRSIGTFPDRTGLLAFLLVHGWFLLVYGLYLLSRSGPLPERRRPAVAALALVVVAGGLVANAAAVAVVLPLLALAWYLLRRDGEVGFETVLFVAGAGLVLLVEFLFVNEQAGPGRFNTVFKTYMEVWVLWGAGTGAALAALVPRPRDLSTTKRRLGTAFVVLLVASTSLYGVVALGAHFQDAPAPTLDGTTWVQTYHPQEWQAIQFLDRQPGRPVIVTAPGCWCNNDDDHVDPYAWANGPSVFTGLPTVAGWSHEVGYRGRAPYEKRVRDVRTIYTGTPAQRVELLGQYDVSYLYVGPNERAVYGNVSVGNTPGLSVAFRNSAVTIYAVSKPAP